MSDKFFGEHLKIILKKQCEVVGADYNKIDFKKEGWFWEYEWTKEEEESFLDWVVNYLAKDIKARRELLVAPSSKSKKNIRKAMSFFVMNDGWKTKEK